MESIVDEFWKVLDFNHSYIMWHIFCFADIVLVLSGRAGRVSSGRVYRMITRRFWEEVIPDYTIPEMQVWLIIRKKNMKTDG